MPSLGDNTYCCHQHHSIWCSCAITKCVGLTRGCFHSVSCNVSNSNNNSNNPWAQCKLSKCHLHRWLLSFVITVKKVNALFPVPHTLCTETNWDPIYFSGTGKKKAVFWRVNLHNYTLDCPTHIFCHSTTCTCFNVQWWHQIPIFYCKKVQHLNFPSHLFSDQ